MSPPCNAVADVDATALDIARRLRLLGGADSPRSLQQQMQAAVSAAGEGGGGADDLPEQERARQMGSSVSLRANTATTTTTTAAPFPSSQQRLSVFGARIWCSRLLQKAAAEQGRLLSCLLCVDALPLNRVYRASMHVLRPTHFISLMLGRAECTRWHRKRYRRGPRTLGSAVRTPGSTLPYTTLAVLRRDISDAGRLPSCADPWERRKICRDTRHSVLKGSAPITTTTSNSTSTSTAIADAI